MREGASLQKARGSQVRRDYFIPLVFLLSETIEVRFVLGALRPHKSSLFAVFKNRLTTPIGVF